MCFFAFKTFVLSRGGNLLLLISYISCIYFMHGYISNYVPHINIKYNKDEHYDLNLFSPDQLLLESLSLSLSLVSIDPTLISLCIF